MRDGSATCWRTREWSSTCTDARYRDSSGSRAVGVVAPDPCRYHHSKRRTQISLAGAPRGIFAITARLTTEATEIVLGGLCASNSSCGSNNPHFPTEGP